MAMNEDSVVASLNELRRMANDRARRETEARGSVEERGGWDQRGGRRRTTEIQGPAGHAPTLLGGHDAGAAPQGGFGYGGYGYGYNHTAQPGAMADMPVESPRPRSAAGPVLLTIVLLGGAAGGAYWKLQQDFQVQLKSRDQALLAAEEGRNKAVELAARAEQLAKVQVASCTKASAEKAAAATTPAAPATAAAAVTAPAGKPALAVKPAKVEKGKRARRAAARRSLARALPPPVEEEKKPAFQPKVVNKKKLNDDPLAGLKM